MLLVEQSIFFETGKKARQKYLLDSHKKEEGNDEESKKISKRTSKIITKSENRNREYKQETENVGKGGKNSLKRLCRVDENGQVFDVYFD